MAFQTFGDVINEVLRYGFNDSPQVNKVRIENWINEAQLQVARKADTSDFQANESLQLVAGTFEYALPTEALRIASIVYPLAKVRLRPVDVQTFDSYQSGANQAAGGIEGPPSVYTIFNKKLWLFPIPSTADKLEVRYYKRPPRMTESANVPVLSEDYLHLLVEYAVFKAYRAEDDNEYAQVHEQRYERDFAKYAADEQDQMDDRPQQLQGTWAL